MRVVKMKQKIDAAIEGRETDLSEDSELDELVDNPQNNEVSALDSLLYENGENKSSGIYLQQIREKMVQEKSEFKVDNRAHNQKLLQSDNKEVLFKALCG